MTDKVQTFNGRRYIAADDALDCIDTVFKLLDLKEEPVYQNFTVIVGPKTTCTVRFDGPVSVDECQSLLAHLAYYKHILIPGEASTKENLRGDLMDAFRKMVSDESQPLG
jgi:hypothetical protein